MTSAQHSSETPRWGTPSDIVERARRLLGRIGFDPMSEAKFQETVKADRYLSLDERGEDALLEKWEDDTFLNPAGGLVAESWDKLVEEILAGRVTKAFWVGFSVEQLCVLSDKKPSPLDFSICFLRKRLKFQHHSDPDKERPSHANYVCAIGVSHSAFCEEFGALGKCLEGELSEEE